MIKKPLFIEFFLILILVAVLHYAATIFFLYWAVAWFDILMHFLGGLLIGLMTLYIFFTSGYVKYPNGHWVVVLSVTLGAVLIVGLAWELWELFAGLSDVLKDRADTILDLIMDMIGGSVAFLYGKNKLWQKIT